MRVPVSKHHLTVVAVNYITVDIDVMEAVVRSDLLNCLVVVFKAASQRRIFSIVASLAWILPRS